MLNEFEGIMRDGKFKSGGNNLLKAHFYDIAVKRNTETRKIRPVKITQTCHIDGFVSIIDAMTVRQKWYAEIGERLKNTE